MKMKTLLLATVVGFGVLGSSPSFAVEDECPVELDVVPDLECYDDTGTCINYFRWTITSLKEGVVIKNFFVNRGICPVTFIEGGEYQKLQLHYGDNLDFRTTTNESMTKCKPREAIIMTNKGTWTFDMR